MSELGICLLCSVFYKSRNWLVMSNMTCLKTTLLVLAKNFSKIRFKMPKVHMGTGTVPRQKFALTLHYYSPRAYNFVRRILKLPHASNICKWNGSIDCEPGFLTNVIDFLGKQAKTDQTLQDCVLIVDAMAIHKGTWFDPKKGTYVGHVDYGGALLEEEDMLATEVLVFLLCGVSGHWKHPVAYFLQMKNSAEVLTHLTKDCVHLLQVSGLNVIDLVFDGTYANQNTAKILGCQVNMECKKTWFTIPQNPSSRVHIIFDVCHILKLV